MKWSSSIENANFDAFVGETYKAFRWGKRMEVRTDFQRGQGWKRACQTDLDSCVPYTLDWTLHKTWSLVIWSQLEKRKESPCDTCSEIIEKSVRAVIEGTF